MNKSTASTNEKWNETIAATMRRAATDTDFRAKCLADPRGAVKEISGLELSPAIQLRFIEPTAGVTVTLPPLQKRGGALSDAALEAVTGGVPPPFTTGCLVGI